MLCNSQVKWFRDKSVFKLSLKKNSLVFCMKDLHVFKIKRRELTCSIKTVVIDLAHSRLLRTKVAIISLFRSPFIWLCLDKSCNTICSLSLFGSCRHRLAAGSGVSSESGSWSRWDWTNEYRWATSSPRVPSAWSGHHQGTIYCKEGLPAFGCLFPCLSLHFILYPSPFYHWTCSECCNDSQCY